MVQCLLYSILPALILTHDYRDAYKAVHDVVNPQYSCDSTTTNNSFIYCYGPILEAVNQHKIYNDSKTFVDMPMVHDPNTTIADFNKTFPMPVADINPDALKNFMDAYFTPVGSELQNCNLSDWKEKPPKLMKISDPNLRNWALQLNAIWKVLCRQVDPKIQQNPEKYSIVYVPNPFIIPGGRFRELYYWDAYWIIKGLLVCDMYNTAQNMISNLASMVDKYGFVPNGGRVYYTKRSQPPLLSGMVYEYFEATQDISFVKTILPTLEKEFNFWNSNRQVNVIVNGATFKVFQYHPSINMPRAESYEEDVIKAPNDTDKNTFWNHVASAAESGWDFSSRWFSDKTTFQKIETANIAQIDLNAFMYWNMDILAYLTEKTESFSKANTYRDLRTAFRDTVTSVFYNDTDGTWYDFNLRTSKHNIGFYPATAVPLFTNCYNTLDQQKPKKMFDYMTTVGAFNYQSGIPTSTIQGATQQWDFPNGWSPLNHMVVEGLRKSQVPLMQDQAFNIATRWVLENYRVWKLTNHMYEKYDVNGSSPEPGFGGEYDVQDGFGWTNGVILDLLNTYNDRMSIPDDLNTVTTTRRPNSSPIVFTLCAIFFYSVTYFI